jgi:hypothetical protein
MASSAVLGTVVHVPGQLDPDPELGDDQWAYKTDDGTIHAVGYCPGQVPTASKRIAFLFRPGREADEVIASYRIPPEQPSPQPGYDFLALLG